MPYDITYMWNPNQDTDELVYETETDIENLPRGGAEGVVRRDGLGVSRCKVSNVPTSNVYFYHLCGPVKEIVAVLKRQTSLLSEVSIKCNHCHSMRNIVQKMYKPNVRKAWTQSDLYDLGGREVGRKNFTEEIFETLKSFSLVQ